MRRRIRPHLTYANVMATVAVFLILGGGTAVAAFVVSSNSQIGPGTISGHHPPTGIHPNIVGGSVTSTDVANNSLTDRDILESSLARVPSATLGGLGGDTDLDTSNCNPDGTTFITCVATDTINLAAPTRVLIIGQVTAFPDVPGGSGQGGCHVGANVGALIDSSAPLSVSGTGDAAAMSGVTDVVGPGPIQFGLDWNQTSGEIRYVDPHLSYVELSPG